jgi:histidyl-tRNA synthetase
MTSKNPIFSPPRGMRDIMPAEMAKRQHVCAKVQEVLSLFGYDQVDPTHVEKIETIFGKAGPGIEKEIYSFPDKGGRRLGLRFELTMGMARMVATNPSWPKPIRIAAISNVWRYDEPQYGRYRAFHQWDIEIFGSDSPSSDAEIVEVSARIMDGLGFPDYEMILSDRQIVEQFLDGLGVEAGHAEIMRVMDKRGKINQEEMAQQLGALEIGESEVSRILEFASNKGGIFEICELLREDPITKANPAIERMERIGTILEESLGLGKISFDLSLVRGLDYYTGFVFECHDPADKALGSVFGGGRFDGLVGIYGRDTPAVGCAGGIERFVVALESKGLLPANILPVPDVFVAPVTEDDVPASMGIATQLRAAGVTAVVEVMGRKLRKSLEAANRAGHKFTVIVGSRDLKEGLVTVREMDSGKERRVPKGDVAEAIITGRS